MHKSFAKWTSRESKDLNVDTCWKMLTLNDKNFHYWHPEVTNITWYDHNDNGKQRRSIGAKRIAK